MKLYALRKPGRPILYTLLLVLITLAALVFSLQAILDSIVLQNAQNQYAYVVSPYGFEQSNPTAAPIDRGVFDRLSQAKQVSATEQVILRAGRLEETVTVPDDTITTEAVTQHYFLEGYYSSLQREIRGNLIYEHFNFVITQNWGHPTTVYDSISVSSVRTFEDPFPENGGKFSGRMFIIGDFVVDQYGINSTYAEVRTANAKKESGTLEGEERIIDKNRFILIPEEVNNTEEYILDKMEETGLLPVYQMHLEAKNPVTVRYVSDMKLIPNCAKGILYADSGRLITPADRGEKVCVISNGLASRNRIVPGDTVKIAVADGHYTIADGQYGAGYESGYPMDYETLLPYGEFEEYTVIGTYYQSGRTKNKGDMRYNSVNDIFVPLPEEGLEDDVARPYTLSFQIPGDKYDSFLAEHQQPLRDMGYNLRVVDNGWESVADSFYAMADRRILIFLSAGLCFLAAALSFGGLVFRHYRKEYGLCRLMGAYQREARRVLYGGFWLSALPAAILSVFGGWGAYILWLKDAVSEDISITLPGNWECLGILAALTAAELLLSVLFVQILLWRQEKKGVLQMR